MKLLLPASHVFGDHRRHGARAWAIAKTVKECRAEWRANKAANQAKGITEKAYVDECRAAGSAAKPKAKAKPRPPRKKNRRPRKKPRPPRRKNRRPRRRRPARWPLRRPAKRKP